MTTTERLEQILMEVDRLSQMNTTEAPIITPSLDETMAALQSSFSHGSTLTTASATFTDEELDQLVAEAQAEQADIDARDSLYELVEEAMTEGSTVNETEDGVSIGFPESPQEVNTTDSESVVPEWEPQVIPENSPTLEVRENTRRFSDADWFQKVQQTRIVLAGLGGIGSYVGFLLGRMQPEYITMYDPDIVEEVNMSGQMFSTDDIGSQKANIVGNILMNKYSMFGRYAALTRPFDRSSHADKIMICGFDNMAARKTFFTAWKNHVQPLSEIERKSCLFIDGRLAAEEFQVFAFTGDDEYYINRYETQYLFTDAEADPTICSYKQTSYMANMIASIMVNIFVNHIANLVNDVIPKEVPFLTEYQGHGMFFNIER